MSESGLKPMLKAISMVATIIVFFVGSVPHATSQTHRIDTLWNVGNSHLGYGVVLAPDGQSFVTNSASHVHAVRPITQPFTVSERCLTGDARRGRGITGVLGLTSSGDLIVEGGNVFEDDANAIMRWKPGEDTLTWQSQGLSYGDMSLDGNVVIGRADDAWYYVDATTGDRARMFDRNGDAYTIGDGRYVLGDRTDSVLLYDTEQKTRAVTINLGDQTYVNGRHRFAFSTDPESKTLWFWGVNFKELQRWDLESGTRLEPFPSPVTTRSETMIFPEMSGNRLAIVDYDTVHVFSVSEQGLTLLWTRAFEDGRVHRVLWRPHSDELVVISDQTSTLITVGTTERGVSISLPTYPEFNYLGSDGLSVLCSDGQNSFYFDASSSQVGWFVQARGPSCQVLESDLVGTNAAEGGQVFAILLNMKTREVLNQIRSQNFSRFAAVSADGRYIASIFRDSVIVVRDVLDTTRTLTIDGTRYGYSFAVDFANDSKELAIIGSNYGSVWNLESFSVIVDSVAALRSYEVFTGTQRFASNLNGDVLVRMTRTAIGVFSRVTNSIVHERDFAPNRINSVQMGADNTILCITDSGEVSILSSVLETMCKDTLGRNVSGPVSVAWNSQKSTIVAHTNENELVYLKYSPLTSVDVMRKEFSSSEALLVSTFDVTLTNAASNCVRVYSSLGFDVTNACNLSQSGDDARIISNELSADAYFIVDLSKPLGRRRVLYVP